MLLVGADEATRLKSRKGGSLDAFENTLLAALPHDQRPRIEAVVQIVALAREQYTHVSQKPLTHVDFPIDAVMSVVATLWNGSTCEVATVGREAFVEVDAALASRIAQRTSFCQIPGHVVRMPLDVFQQQLSANTAFRTLVLRAVRARVFITEQLVMCNLKHTIGERFARWLLMTRERIGRDEIRITHEFLAMMLGARRAGISHAAATLQTAGSIVYGRGVLKILDPTLLLNQACECYRESRDALERSFADEA